MNAFGSLVSFDDGSIHGSTSLVNVRDSEKEMGQFRAEGSAATVSAASRGPSTVEQMPTPCGDRRRQNA